MSVLDCVDRVQRRLLRELGLTELEGLTRYRLAPLPSRRDMAMLGVLHKVVLGLAPPQLAAFFPLWEMLQSHRADKDSADGRPFTASSWARIAESDPQTL